jgi:hypothetical protein
VTLKKGKQKTFIGWQVIRTHVRCISSLPSLPPITFEQLLSLIENKMSELRKVVKGVISPITGFCAKDKVKETIKRFLSVLNSGHSEAVSDRLDAWKSLPQKLFVVQVQEALTELVAHQIFRELFWAALLIPVDGLADKKHTGRIADLFPDELCASAGCVSQDTVGNLLTLVSLFLTSTILKR